MKDKWVDELFGVLWAYRITSRWPIRITPFALAYDMEVIIPTEIGLPMVKTIVQESEINEGNLEMYLDWVDEEREVGAVRMASYQQRAMTQYNKRVHPQLFHPRDLVLRQVFENTTEVGVNKL